MLLVLSGVLGAALFAAAGWLGKFLADMWFGAIEREDDGPLPVTLPQWVYVVAPACVGLTVGIRSAQPVQVAILLLAVVSLAACAAIDCRTGLIPDMFTLGPLILVLSFAALRHEWAPILGALFAFVPFAAIAAISRGRGMGWGDVKLATLGGALVGMSGITLAVAMASAWVFLSGAFRGRPRRPIAFGPYLVVSIGAAVGFGGSL
jgi:leader peptidase (prepilin peptidase)/N-methyltransferase